MGKRGLGLGVVLDIGISAQQPCMPGGAVQRPTLIKRVRELLGERDHVSTDGVGLVGLTLDRKSGGEKTATPDSRVLAILKGMGGMLLRIVQGQALLQVPAGAGQFAQPEE